jgi:hypothetical protein
LYDESVHHILHTPKQGFGESLSLWLSNVMPQSMANHDLSAACNRHFLNKDEGVYYIML